MFSWSASPSIADRTAHPWTQLRILEARFSWLRLAKGDLDRPKNLTLQPASLDGLLNHIIEIQKIPSKEGTTFGGFTGADRSMSG